MIDLSKYEGHTPGEWHVQECGHDTTYQADAYINGPEGCIAGVWGTRKASGQGPNARLIADAPLLLAEVRRLRADLLDTSGREARLGLEYEAAEREFTALRQSHARLLAAIKADADIVETDETLCWCSKPPEVDHYGHCAELRAAVAEAEGL